MLIDMNEVTIMLDELNREINFKLSEQEPCLYNSEGGDYLQLSSAGNHIQIFFLGSILYCSRMEQELENIPVEKQIELNEREKFELHLRLLVNDKINFFKNLEM